MQVLYEDNHLIAVLKPAGVLSQGDETRDVSIGDQVKNYLKEKYNKPGNVFLGILHRLDRPVSGIVLFAKTSKAASRLSEQFRLHKVEKVYYAITEGCPKEKTGTIRSFLKKDKNRNISASFDEKVFDSKESVLDYFVVETNKKFSLIKVDLETGRSHQIRLQLSSVGCPIVGDLKYGSKIKTQGGNILLFSAELSFFHPITEVRQKIEIDKKVIFEKFKSLK